MRLFFQVRNSGGPRKKTIICSYEKWRTHICFPSFGKLISARKRFSFRPLKSLNSGALLLRSVQMVGLSVIKRLKLNKAKAILHTAQRQQWQTLLPFFTGGWWYVSPQVHNNFMIAPTFTVQMRPRALTLLERDSA